MPYNRHIIIIIILSFVLALGVLNPIYGTIGICSFECIYLCFWPNKKIIIPNCKSFLFLALFGITYVLFGQFTVAYIEYYFVALLLAFLAGYCCNNYYETETSDIGKRTKCVIYTIFFAESLHAFLNIIINIGNARWELVDVFRGLRVATGSEFINTFVLSLLFVFIIIEKQKLLKIIGIICLAISITYSFILGSRTTYIVVATVLLIDIILYWREKFYARVYLKLLFKVLLLIIAVLYIYNKDFFNIKTFIDESNLISRFTEVGLEKSDQYRSESFFLGLINLLDYPFGGLIDRGYYHNMWLDAGRIGGIFPFLFLLLYSITTFIHVISLFRNKQLSISYRYIIISLYVGILFNCCSEPVLEGIMDSFLVFVFINGIVEGDYIKTKKSINNPCIIDEGVKNAC